MKFNIGVFASGKGSNFESLIKSQNIVFTSDIKMLISNNSDCGAIQIAKKYNISCYHISRKRYPELSEDDYVNLFIEKLRLHNIELILLAGYMKKIDDKIIHEFRDRIINIHPALLPKFGGRGMYGINVHKSVINSGEKRSGITIHLVDEQYDHGRIIFQKEIDISQVKNEIDLQERILKLEHEYYPKVIKLIEDGVIKL